MQNTGHAQKTRADRPGRSVCLDRSGRLRALGGRRRIVRRVPCSALRPLSAACARVIVSLACALALTAVAPLANGARGALTAPADGGSPSLAAPRFAASQTVAHADTVASPRVSIDARVGADGSLHVVERRVLVGEGGSLSAVWRVEAPSDNAELVVNSVRFAAADANGETMGAWTELPSTYFVVDWRGGGGPDEDSFAVDNPQNAIYVFVGAGADSNGVDAEAAEGAAAPEGDGESEGADGGESEPRDAASASSGDVASLDGAGADNGADAAAADGTAAADAAAAGAAVDAGATTSDAAAAAAAADDASATADDSDAADQNPNAKESPDRQTRASFIVEIDYTIVNGVAAYEDVGEVYWKYVSDEWGVASEQVTMTLTLPVPQGVSVVAGDNVHAWGHGPQNGTFSVNDDGTITYSADRVEAGQFAEARVTFPVGWLYDVSDEARAETGDTRRLSTALSEEDGWADQDSMRRLAELNRAATSAIVCAVALLAAVIAYLAFGRERKPDFTGDYWCDVPDGTLHPALAGRLWRWNHPSRADFVATVMRLRNAGALTWEWRASDTPPAAVDDAEPAASGTPPVPANGAGSAAAAVGEAASCSQGDTPPAAVGDAEPPATGSAEPPAATGDRQLVMRSLAAPSSLDDPFDAKALSALFDAMAKGASELTMADIRRFGEESAHAYVQVMSAFNDELDAEVGRRGYFDERSRTVQKVVLVAALVMLVGGIALSLLVGSAFPVAFAVPTALAMAVLGNHLPRRSIGGNNLVARCKALRNWLLEFGDRGESLSDAMVDWRLLAPYAYQFGVLDAAVANAWGSDDAREAADCACAADELRRTLDEAMRAARSAMSSERSSFGGDVELNTWPHG